ncbi:MAG: hypothetical protein FJX55_04865 [Alphaproteobacteria bacterium]|nr:hypothetical protein [Alphaproteobacteria bacterium]
MLQHAYAYTQILTTSQRINWRVEDIIGGDKKLDFSRPFLPESLARVEPLKFLDRDEKLVLNHIRAHGYLYIFGLVEEFILPFVMDHARSNLSGDDVRTRAMLQFAGEEAKHIDLFKRFGREFVAGFGTRCDDIGPPEAIGKAVLAHDPLSVALLILHIESMTQRHYVDSTRDDQTLDPQFKSLLKHHWMEEAQHAKLDTLMVEALAVGRPKEDIAKAMDGYLSLGGLFDGGIKQQAEFDIPAFVAATGRTLTAAERSEMAAQQHQAQRWTYIGSGMSHPNFLASVGALSPEWRKKLEEIAPQFS